jgi:flavin-dependent thymidylate synthase
MSEDRLMEQPEQIIIRNPNAYLITDSKEILRQIINCARIAKISRGIEFEPCRFVDLEEARNAIEFILKLQNKTIPHKSILEFISFDAFIICSRIVSHEIVRHRLCSFMQSSTRYILATKNKVVTFIDPELKHDIPTNYHNPILRPDLNAECPDWLPAAVGSIKGYIGYLNKGHKIEQARYLLPHNIAASLVVKTNLSEWAHILKVRTDKNAAPEAQFIFNTIKNEFSEILSLTKFTSINKFWDILLKRDFMHTKSPNIDISVENALEDVYNFMCKDKDPRNFFFDYETHRILDEDTKEPINDIQKLFDDFLTKYKK